MTTDKNTSYIEKLASGIARKAVQDAVRAVSGKAKKLETAATEEAVPEAAAQSAIAIETDADPAADAKCAYIFFNCDASKAPASMNIRFNDEVYRDYPAGREDLLAKVEAELAAGNIKIADLGAVKKAILEGQPGEASALMEFGCIECLIMS